MSKGYYHEFAFIVYPPCNFSSDTIDEYRKYIIDSLETTNYLGWVSDLHSRPEDADYECELKPHIHILVETDTRETSLSSIKKVIQPLGLNIAGDGKFFLKIDNWRGYLRYLDHSNRPEKEQVRKPLPFNQPAENYDAQISTSKYFHDVLSVINKYCVTNAKEFTVCVNNDCCDWFERAFNDLNKWEKFFYVKKSASD